MQIGIRRLCLLILTAVLAAAVVTGSTWAQTPDPDLYAQALQSEDIEAAWHPDYLSLATGDPYSTDHGVYEWPFALDSIGWSLQSYQDYGGTPYFHHGMDMMKMWGTQVFNRSGGQVINIENYQPGWDLYWEVAVLDPDGYIWQYHHIQMETIPQYIWDKFEEWQIDPVNGGFIDPGTHIGNIIEWPVWSFGKQFNHIHLNIIAAGGYYVNGFEFHNPLPDDDGPEIQSIGLLDQNNNVVPGNNASGNYSLYVQSRDLILDDVFYLPPWEFKFSLDCGPEQTTYRFDRLPGIDRSDYLFDFYAVPPTCGDYDCRNYYVDLGFIPESHFMFPNSSGQHTIHVTVKDYAGSSDSQSFTFNVTGQPNQAPTADPQSVTAQEGRPLAITLTGSDPNHDPLVFSVDTPPDHGTLSGGSPNLIYTPDDGYTGTDSFTFVANDCVNTSAPAAIDINVVPNQPPIANPQSVTTAEDIPLAITLTGSDPDGDTLNYTVLTTPTNGTLGGIAPNLVYTPTLNYNGTDSFTFVVDDGLETSAPALVDLEVSPVNDPPVADPQSVTTTQDVPVAITLTGSDPDLQPFWYTVVTTPTHGTLTGTAPNLLYTPSPGYFGPDSFTFIVGDGTLVSEEAIVSITINPFGLVFMIYIPVVFR